MALVLRMIAELTDDLNSDFHAASSSLNYSVFTGETAAMAAL